jgi:hypothetical protein
MTTDELKAKLGLRPDQLLRSEDGFLGDILAVEGELVVIGILATGRTEKIPIKNIIMSTTPNPT